MGDGYHIIASVGETVLRVWFSSWVYLMLEGNAVCMRRMSDACLIHVREMGLYWRYAVEKKC